MKDMLWCWDEGCAMGQQSDYCSWRRLPISRHGWIFSLTEVNSIFSRLFCAQTFLEYCTKWFLCYFTCCGIWKDYKINCPCLCCLSVHPKKYSKQKFKKKTVKKYAPMVSGVIVQLWNKNIFVQKCKQTYLKAFPYFRSEETQCGRKECLKYDVTNECRRTEVRNTNYP